MSTGWNKGFLVHNKVAGQNDKKPVVTVPLPTHHLAPHGVRTKRQEP
jgi:hypothetical protein